MEPIDFVLSLIDYARDDEEQRVTNILGIKNYAQEVLDMQRNRIDEASFAKANMIIWR
jgi:hypothetical protein